MVQNVVETSRSGLRLYVEHAGYLVEDFSARKFVSLSTFGVPFPFIFVASCGGDLGLWRLRLVRAEAQEYILGLLLRLRDSGFYGEEDEGFR